MSQRPCVDHIGLWVAVKSVVQEPAERVVSFPGRGRMEPPDSNGVRYTTGSPEVHLQSLPVSVGTFLVYLGLPGQALSSLVFCFWHIWVRIKLVRKTLLASIARIVPQDSLGRIQHPGEPRRANRRPFEDEWLRQLTSKGFRRELGQEPKLAPSFSSWRS